MPQMGCQHDRMPTHLDGGGFTSWRLEFSKERLQDYISHLIGWVSKDIHSAHEKKWGHMGYGIVDVMGNYSVRTQVPEAITLHYLPQHMEMYYVKEGGGLLYASSPESNIFSFSFKL
jgi:hypothetical protein